MLTNVNKKQNHFLRNSSDVLSINAYDWYIDLIVFYAVSAMFQPYNGGKYAYDEKLATNANASYHVDHANMMH